MAYKKFNNLHPIPHRTIRLEEERIYDRLESGQLSRADAAKEKRNLHRAHNFVEDNMDMRAINRISDSIDAHFRFVFVFLPINVEGAGV